jgi:hypothetical protein
VPVRRGGVPSSLEEGRTLIDDLYADRQVRHMLASHGVVIPDEWTPTGLFESLAPFPLSLKLGTALYKSVGIPMLHIALLLGWEWGPSGAHGARPTSCSDPPGQPESWTIRRYSG